MAGETIESVLRDFQTNGVPGSGKHEIVKSEFRNLLNAFLGQQTGANAGALIQTSKAALDALAPAANTMAWVIGDADPDLDGVYQYSGGTWTKRGPLPYGVIHLNNAGAGTGDAIEVTTAFGVPDAAFSAVYVLNVVEANTGPVTVSINGGVPKPVVNSTGSALDAGSLQPGAGVLGLDDGTNIRLFLYGDVEAILAAAEAARDAAEASANSVSTRIFLSLAVAEAADIPAATKRVQTQFHTPSFIEPATMVGGAHYRRVDDEPSHPLKFRSADRAMPNGTTDAQNGGWWEIDEPALFVEMAGGGVHAADNKDAIEAISDYLTARGGGTVRFREGTYTHSPFQPRNFVFLAGASKKATLLLLLAGSNANGIETAGFADFADDIDRSYTWHSSTAARNAQSYSTGKYVMVAASSTDFNNATWYEAIATPATGDEDWGEVSPVVGCVGGGIRDMAVDGNRSNQVGDHIACAWYGIDTTFIDVVFQGGATSLHGEAPGAVFSTQVGENLQGTVRGLEIRDFTVCGFLNNMQSDMCFYDLQVYAPDTVLVSDALLHSKQKASGHKYFGGHIWAGADGTLGWICDALTNSSWGMEVERPVKVNAGGFRFDGQVYRANEASGDDGPAFELAASVSGCSIKSRVNWFRHPIKINLPVGDGNQFNLTHYTTDASAAPFDPSGSTLPGPTKNRWEIIVTGTGFSTYSMPFMYTYRVRRRRQFIAYTASITPDHAGGDYIEIGQLTGNVTINAPASAAEGDEIQFMFQQDGTGSRTITWNAVFVGGPTAGGAAFQRRAVRFVFDGTEWIVCGDSGAWV